METARHPTLETPEAAPAEPGGAAGADAIPTLEIEVPALQIPTLAEPVHGVREISMRPGTRGPAAANTVERIPPLDANQRTSRRIIATVACGLMAVASLPWVFETVGADGDGQNTDPTRITRAQIQVPTLVLLSESSRAPVLPLTTKRLMESTTALLATRNLQDQATVDFALHSLRTVLLADADNAVARQRLVDLTGRLTDEATHQFDIGNRALARQLIQQAANSGVAQERVNLAAAYIAVPQAGI